MNQLIGYIYQRNENSKIEFLPVQMNLKSTPYMNQWKKVCKDEDKIVGRWKVVKRQSVKFKPNE